MIFSDKTLNIFMDWCQRFETEEEMAAHVAMLAALSVSVMRGIDGHEETIRFLQEMINDKTPMVIQPVKAH